MYIDGCFWHGCPEHLHMPKANAAWWVAKIGMNKARDASATAQLESLGWTVLRFWEHEEPEYVASAILEQLAKQLPTGGRRKLRAARVPHDGVT